MWCRLRKSYGWFFHTTVYLNPDIVGYRRPLAVRFGRFSSHILFIFTLFFSLVLIISVYESSRYRNFCTRRGYATDDWSVIIQIPANSTCFSEDRFQRQLQSPSWRQWESVTYYTRVSSYLILKITFFFYNEFIRHPTLPALERQLFILPYTLIKNKENIQNPICISAFLINYGMCYGPRNVMPLQYFI